MIYLFLFAVFLDEKWEILLDKYKIYKDVILAASDEDVICVAVPWTQDLLFFDRNAKLICRYTRDNDAPDGFRQIVSLGFHSETNRFYVYDFGRKISFWSEQGEFQNAIFLQPLLSNPILLASQNLVYVSDDSGSINTKPSLMLMSLETSEVRPLLSTRPLEKINGYRQRTNPGPPVKLPWHHQFLLARGRKLFACCYNRENTLTIFDGVTLEVKHCVAVPMPSVPVDDRRFKETLKLESKSRGIPLHELVLDTEAVFSPVPLKIMINSADQIFVYGQNFLGYQRFLYDGTGSLLEKRKVETVPSCMNRNYHYMIESDNGYRVIIRTNSKGSESR